MGSPWVNLGMHGPAMFCNVAPRWLGGFNEPMVQWVKSSETSRKGSETVFHCRKLLSYMRFVKNLEEIAPSDQTLERQKKSYRQ